MSRKMAKAHWTYTIMLNGIEGFPHPLIANNIIIKLFIKLRRCQANKNVLRINQTRYQFHFEAYIGEKYNENQANKASSKYGRNIGFSCPFGRECFCL